MKNMTKRMVKKMFELVKFRTLNHGIGLGDYWRR
jgi:hypothetical protein